MASHSPATGLAPAGGSDLRRLFADRWKISYDSSLAVWSAEQRSADGRQIRVICDFSADGLASKLTRAEARP